MSSHPATIEASPAMNILALPPDMIRLILSEITDFRSLIAAFSSCKYFRQVARNHPEIWRSASPHHPKLADLFKSDAYAFHCTKSVNYIHRRLHQPDELLQPELRAHLPNRAPAVDIRTHTSPLHIAYLMFCSRAWFKLYCFALLHPNQNAKHFRRLTERFRRSTQYTMRGILYAFICWTYYRVFQFVWKQSSVGFPALLCGLTCGIAFNLATFLGSPVSPWVHSSASLLALVVSNVYFAWINRSPFFPAILSTVIAGLVFKGARKRHRIFQSLLAAGFAFISTFLIAMVGVPVLTPIAYCVIGGCLGYFATPNPLKITLPRSGPPTGRPRQGRTTAAY